MYVIFFEVCFIAVMAILPVVRGETMLLIWSFAWFIGGYVIGLRYRSACELFYTCESRQRVIYGTGGTPGVIITDSVKWRIRYDTRCYFNVRSKADVSRLNLPHGNDN